MFKLDLDLSLYFKPPMDEHGQGIVLKRTLELPFPPYPDLMVYGKQIDNSPEPLGFMLKDVIWDMDRQVFLANATHVSCDLPIVFIPREIRSWVDRGWRLGSYLDAYPEQEETEDDGKQCETEQPDRWEEMETWLSLPPRKRSKEFNKVLRALVREMADLFNDSATAYAIDKTGMFFDKADCDKRDTIPVKQWMDAHYEFMRMSTDDQLAWRDRVLKKHPRLDRIVAEL